MIIFSLFLDSHPAPKLSTGGEGDSGTTRDVCIHPSNECVGLNVTLDPTHSAIVAKNAIVT